MNFNKKYWSKNEFINQDGTPYEGYVGIYNGNGYIFDTEELLKKKDSWYTKINCSDLFFDRILDEDIKLPYSKNEITVQANDFLNKNIISSILKKLQYNSEYIFKNGVLSNTLIPAVDDCSIFASNDTSSYVYVTAVDSNNNPTKTVSKVSKNITTNGTNKDIIKWTLNVNFNGSEDTYYPLQANEKGKSLNGFINAGLKNNGIQYRYYPYTIYKPKIEEGILKQYSVSTYKKTKTHLDKTFYKTDNSTEPKYDLNQVTSSAIKILDVKSDGTAKVLLFLAFKTKVLVLKFKYNVIDFNKNKDIKFNFNTDNVTFDKSSEKGILSFDTADPNNNNSLNFIEISNIYIHDTNLFLIDKELNMIVRYDINNLCQEIDNWYVKSNIKILDCLQGEGQLKNQIHFKHPKAVTANDEYIYIADSGNNCIKVYNSGFNFLRTLKAGEFSNKDIQTISLNPYNIVTADGVNLPSNSLWVFSTNDNYLYITVLNNNKVIYSSRIAKIRLLKDEYSWKEEFKSVCFSKTNSNYFYICTTKRIYKFHTSKPNYPFASLSYFKLRNSITTMVWNSVTDPWHNFVINDYAENDDEDIIEDEESSNKVVWSYAPETSTSAEILRNYCFCLDCFDKKDNQFNGDLIFHIGILYNANDLNDYFINDKNNSNVDFNDPSLEIDLNSMIESTRNIFI